MEGGTESDWASIGRIIGWTQDSSSAGLTSAFVRHLLDHLSKYQELQRSQADALLQAARSEQLCRQMEEQLATTEARLVSARAELEAIGSKHEHASSELRHLQTERGELLAALEEARSLEGRFRAKLSALEGEKTDLQRGLDRKTADKAALEADHERLLAVMGKLRKATAEAEERYIDLQRDHSRLQFEHGRAHGELEQLREKVQWNETELDKVLNEVAEYRRQKAAELSLLNSVLLEKTTELEAASSRLSSLQGQLEERNRQFGEALDESRQLRTEFTKAKADFEAEMGSKSRLVELYKSASEEADSRISELESSLQQAVAKLEELEEANAERDKETAQTKKKHVADVFAENSQSRLELARLRQENEKLKTCLEEICGEIEARAPLLNQERKENDRLKRELMAITSQVVELGRTRDELELQNSASREQVEWLKKENYSLTMQSRDLMQQLEAPTTDKIGDGADEGGSQQQSQHSSVFADAIDDSDDPVTVFRSVTELQSRNADLLKRVYELEYELQSLRSASVDGRQLEKALKEIEELNEARGRQSAMLEALLKQQQQQPLSSGGGNLVTRQASFSSAASSAMLVDSNIESLLSERTRIEQSLQEQLQLLRSENSDLKVRLGKAESSLQYVVDSLDVAKRSLASESEELAQLRSRIRELTDVNMRLTAQLQEYAAEAINAKEREGKAGMALGRCQNELSAARASEERHFRELQETRSDRDRCARLISQMQLAVSSQDAGYKEMRDRAAEQMQLLEDELRGIRQRLSDEIERSRATLQASDAGRKELLDKQEQLLDELSRVKSELIKLQAEGGSSRFYSSSASNSTDTSSSEYYKALARASETALEELSKSFEQYREQTESSGMARYEEVCRELESVKEQLLTRQQSFDNERSEYVSRLATLEQVELQLREHGDMRLEDIVRLQESLDQARSDLLAERAQSDNWQQELAKLSQALKEHCRAEAELRLQLAEHQSQSSSHEQDRNEWQKRLDNLQTRFDALSKQYNTLLDKLENSLKPPSYLFSNVVDAAGAGDGNDGQLQQVISYLRRERDVLDQEKGALEAENRRLLAQYDQMSAAYNQLKKTLTAADDAGTSTPAADFKRQTKELQELRASIEQLSGIKESAALMQAQVGALSDKLSQAETELEETRSRLQPLRESNRDLRSSLAAKEQEVRMVADDRDMWRRRCEDARHHHLHPHPHGTSPPAMPASEDDDDEEEEDELNRLKASLEETRKERDQIVEEANQKLSNLESRYNKAIERFNFYKKKSEELQAKLNELMEAGDGGAKTGQPQLSSNDQLAAIASELEETRSLLRESLEQKDQLASRLASSEQRIGRLQGLLTKYKTLRRDYDALKSEYEGSCKSLQDGVGRLEGRLGDMAQEHTLHQTALTSQWRTRLEKLQASLEEYKQHFGEISNPPPDLRSGSNSTGSSHGGGDGRSKMAAFAHEADDDEYYSEEDDHDNDDEDRDGDGDGDEEDEEEYERGGNQNGHDHGEHSEEHDDDRDEKRTRTGEPPVYSDDFLRGDVYSDERYNEDEQEMLAERSHQHSNSANANNSSEMTDDDIMPLITPNPLPAKPRLVSLSANVQALSPTIPAAEDGRPRSRFVNLSGIRSSSANAPPTPQALPSQALPQKEQKKRGGKGRGGGRGKRRNQ